MLGRSWLLGWGALSLCCTAIAQDTDLVVLPAEGNQEDYEARLKEIDALRDAAFKQYGSVGIILLGQSDPQKIVFCDAVAQAHAGTAAASTNRSLREERFLEVWRFEQRLGEPLEQAKRDLGEDSFRRQQSEAAQALGILSMMRDPMTEELYEETGDLMFAWSGSMVFRCVQILDDIGVGKIHREPPADYIAEKARYRWRGLTYQQVFKDTDLIPFADQMCEEAGAPDLALAPLDQRGTDGMSLLDWAIECDDQVAFEALISSGADLNALGLWKNPPLVNSARKAKIWFLERLLDAGVHPDVEGASGTALSEAYGDLDASNAGDFSLAAYKLLRERGASLNFPNHQRSMWSKWEFRSQRMILENWSEFESDPVDLGDSISFAISEGWVGEKDLPAAKEILKLLERDFGVCFPIERKPFSDWKRDNRGFLVQEDCPTKD